MHTGGFITRLPKQIARLSLPIVRQNNSPVAAMLCATNRRKQYEFLIRYCVHTQTKEDQGLINSISMSMGLTHNACGLEPGTLTKSLPSHNSPDVSQLLTYTAPFHQHNSAARLSAAMPIPV